LAVRASKRFKSDDALLDQFGAGRLRRALDQFELWRGHDHVEVRQVITDFATYLYLPRLRDRQLVHDAIKSVRPPGATSALSPRAALRPSLTGPG
jgi:hypothetical protein